MFQLPDEAFGVLIKGLKRLLNLLRAQRPGHKGI